MMSIKSMKIPGVGMRNVKTALAAAFCAFIYYFFDRSPGVLPASVPSSAWARIWRTPARTAEIVCSAR